MDNQTDESHVAINAATPVGRKGNPLTVRPGTNQPTTINGREFSGHALDRMQEKGIPPSVVENTIQQGQSVPGKVPGTTAYYDPVNDMTVITDSKSGRVITVGFGKFGGQK